MRLAPGMDTFYQAAVWCAHRIVAADTIHDYVPHALVAYVWLNRVVLVVQAIVVVLLVLPFWPVLWVLHPVARWLIRKLEG